MSFFINGNIFLYIVFILVHNGNGEECTKVKSDQYYSCEGRNLTYVPTSIPLFIEMLDFSFNFLPSLQKSTFPRLDYLKRLDLTRCHIQYIADDAFHNVRNVTTLILTGNPVSYIGPDGLNSLLKLHRLVLVNTGLHSLNIQLENLTELQELKAGTNNIQSIALPPFMINFNNFCLLDLHVNNISTIKLNQTSVLRGMRANITLILSRNPILHIEPGAFQGIYLEELNILGAFVSSAAKRDGLKALRGLKVGRLSIGNYNFKKTNAAANYLDGLCSMIFKEIYLLRIEKFVSEDMYTCLINATKITLNHCYITAMQHVPFPNLKELYIANSEEPIELEIYHLHSLEKLVVVENRPTLLKGLNYMPNLQHVDLSRNNLVFSQFDCCTQYFIGMPNLRSLNLSDNQNMYLSKNPFAGFSSIEILDVRFTRLGFLSRQFELFKNLKNLKYLDISYSSSNILRTMTFGHLSHLQVLKASGNHFQEDALNYVFVNLTALEILEISDCGILNIEARAFKGLTRLKHLFLSQNKLVVLDFVTHPYVKSLTMLNVERNTISSISNYVLQNLPKNLSVLDLSFNPFDCSCSQIAFISWITSHQHLIQQSNNLFCRQLTQGSKIRVLDYDIESCEHIRRLTIVLSICAVTVLSLGAVLTYKFQFYLRYGCILLRGYKVSRLQEFSYDAFVIYSSKDESWVMNELLENLENGIPPIQLCLHVRDFEVGKTITSNIIDEGIMGSRKIIVVVSQHFIESSWCRFEFEVAQSWLVMQGNANIIIIILEDVEEEKTKKVFGLHKHLKKNTYLKWSGNPLSKMRFWIRLRKAITTGN
ncbi:toll-like receptor 4 [Trichomycterus rosablanca]|uniref:toll-like receptor 4 n=1 Tax=Trichomycterus rosablanca TaxID=2290929 RepID=UPI002F35E538